MLRPPETIQTDRLLLRPPTLEDAEAVFTGYAGDPEVTRYLMWRPHTDVGVTREFMRRCVACWQEGNSFPWLVTRASDGALLGMIELRIDGHKAELGYVLAKPYWGQGIGGEMARAVADWAFAQAKIYRVWATCDVDNPASARVMEKAGMQFEGLVRRTLIHPNLSAEPRDGWVYARVK